MLNRIKQNDERCYPKIQRIGCFFRSCGLIAEDRTGKELTVEQINAGWDWAVSCGHIGDVKDSEGRVVDTDCVKNSAAIATYFLNVLGDRGRFLEVGTFRDGVTSYYGGVRGTKYARADALIQKIKQNGPSKVHFRDVNARGELIEDPHEPAITCRGIYYSILYAYQEEGK